MWGSLQKNGPFTSTVTHNNSTELPLPLIPTAVVCDLTMGSGSTGVAAVNTGRNFIGIEKDAGYFKIAQERIAQAMQQKSKLPCN